VECADVYHTKHVARIADNPDGCGKNRKDYNLSSFSVCVRQHNPQKDWRKNLLVTGKQRSTSSNDIHESRK
jgi:hypothetical protein